VVFTLSNHIKVLEGLQNHAQAHWHLYFVPHTIHIPVLMGRSWGGQQYQIRGCKRKALFWRRLKRYGIEIETSVMRSDWWKKNLTVLYLNYQTRSCVIEGWLDGTWLLFLKFVWGSSRTKFNRFFDIWKTSLYCMAPLNSNFIFYICFTFYLLLWQVPHRFE